METLGAARRHIDTRLPPVVKQLDGLEADKCGSGLCS